MLINGMNYVYLIILSLFSRMNHFKTALNQLLKSAKIQNFQIAKTKIFNFGGQKFYAGQHFCQQLYGFWKAYICISFQSIYCTLPLCSFLCTCHFLPRHSDTKFQVKTSLEILGNICCLNVDKNVTIWKSIKKCTFFVYKSFAYLLPIKTYIRFCKNPYTGYHLCMRLSYDKYIHRWYPV